MESSLQNIGFKLKKKYMTTNTVQKSIIVIFIHTDIHKLTGNMHQNNYFCLLDWKLHYIKPYKEIK
jgi:hypothetical protein